MKKLFLLFSATIICALSMAQANSFLHDTTSTLVRLSGHYVLGDTYLTIKQVGQLYENQCPDAFAKYKSAKACTAAGATVFALGGLEIVGVTAFSGALNSRTRPVAYSIGSIVASTGLIVMLCAPLKYMKAVDIYNERKTYKFTFVPSAGADGIGLAIRW